MAPAGGLTETPKEVPMPDEGTDRRASERPDDDPRFTFGLVLDVVDAFEDHGYPKVTDGGQLVTLQAALFGFLYGTGGPGLDDSGDQ
jgi:hypothetical protein